MTALLVSGSTPMTRVAGSQLLDRGADARDQPSPADADHDHVDLRQVLDDLQADGALARDDTRIVERVQEEQAALVAQLLHPRERVPDVLAVEDDLGAVAARRPRLGARRVEGHDHGRPGCRRADAA